MGEGSAQDSSWQLILTQQMWISFVLFHIFFSLRGKWWEDKKPRSQKHKHLDVSMDANQPNWRMCLGWKTPKVKWGHMARDMQEALTSLMHLIGMWASFAPHVPSRTSLYWNFDPNQ